MNLDNLYISAYIENVCFSPDGVQNGSKSQELLQELKTVAPKEFKEVESFNQNVRAFEEMYASDEDYPNEAQIIAQYENSIDKSELPNKYKLKLYDNLASYYEKNRMFSKHYFAILDKKIALLEPGDDTNLNIIARCAIIARRSVPKEVYLTTLQRAYNKCSNKYFFPRREDELKIKFSLNSKEGKYDLTPIEKLSKQDIRNRVYAIQDILKNKDLLAKEKISLALEAINLATKTPFHRSKNFEIKRDMNLLIADEYKKGNNLDLAGKYEAEAQRWQRSIENAIDKAYTKHPQYFDRFR